MDPIHMRLLLTQAPDFVEDLTAWANSGGMDPRLSVIAEPGATSQKNSPIAYQVHVNDSFFDQFPQWRMYIEE
ncbi:hypothetical protein [Paraburkholderia strydomiana]|uniref:hypothetical protein n=1 Tax=Paraburkholderia strydomiana TaxID=1245417 RepID=UPI001BE635FF|nr:hypothetical protein [Paraburkholderia strydomiana]MBT2792731.1 hypothetical protein [Paraburkholderia strydomiana]